MRNMDFLTNIHLYPKILAKKALLQVVSQSNVSKSGKELVLATRSQSGRPEKGSLSLWSINVYHNQTLEESLNSAPWKLTVDHKHHRSWS